MKLSLKSKRKRTKAPVILSPVMPIMLWEPPYSGHYERLRAAKAYAQAFKEVPVIVDKSKSK